MLKQKFSDKFTNIFSRDKKQRSEETKKNQPIFFNQSYFECKLVYNPHKLSLIKVIANIMVGPDAGTPMMVSCKWLIKKNNQYSQIQGVTSSCYQPCIQDVGCSILVQITPLIEGKTYSGATIVKQTGLLQLGSTLQTQFTQIKSKLYYQKQQIQFQMKVQAIFGKQTEYSNLQYPQDGKFIIHKHQDLNFQIQIYTAQFKTYFWIIKEFPTVQFIRKSYNSVVISFNEYQSMRLAFKQGTDRQILGLLLRTLTANSTLDWPAQDNHRDKQANSNRVQKKISIQLQQSKQIEQTPNKQQKQGSETNLSSKKSSGKRQQSDLKQQIQTIIIQNTPVKQIQSCQDLNLKTTPLRQQLKSQAFTPSPSPNNSLIQLQLKMGQMNTQLNKIKKEYKELMKNYNIEKQNKCKLQHQIKRINDKLTDYQKIQKQKSQLLIANQKLKEDNRFYRNQVSLLNKNMKKLQLQLSNGIKQKQMLEKKFKSDKNQTQAKRPPGIDIQDMLRNQSQNWRKLNNQLVEQNQQLKDQIQKLQNNLATVNKKLQSWHQQKLSNSHEYIKIQPKISSADNNTLPLQLNKKNKIISNLQFKISNLQMLLKHRSGQRGNQALTLHKIINNLTEDITQKSQQLEQVKKINKQLLQKIQTLTKNK